MRLARPGENIGRKPRLKCKREGCENPATRDGIYCSRECYDKVNKRPTASLPQCHNPGCDKPLLHGNKAYCCRECAVAHARATRAHPMRRLIVTPDGVFLSIRMAAAHYGIHESTAKNRAKNNLYGWSFRDES